MADFFISYTGVDESWAEWVGYVLEEAGFTTIIQAWDFRPGSNFILNMQTAATAADRTIMVLSPDYLKSQMAAPEWAAAFRQDPQGVENRLLPVMVRACQPSGMLAAIVQIRIHELEEPEAKKALLAGVNSKRAKPSNPPAFPGRPVVGVAHKDFPGAGAPAAAATPAPLPPVIPKLRQAPTDVDRRRFLKQGLETIRQAFEANLKQAAQDEPRLEPDFTAATSVDFTAELFLDGQSKCRTRVWLSSEARSESIAVQEGRTSGNAMNEILYVSSEADLSFSSTMPSGYHGDERQFDLKHLSAEDAAAYLWQRFVRPLSY